jgi:hypothetical protein
VTWHRPNVLDVIGILGEPVVEAIDGFAPGRGIERTAEAVVHGEVTACSTE